ncbi:HEAT repeat domain-containing protein, partial [Chitiniphilus eburneus]
MTEPLAALRGDPDYLALAPRLSNADAATRRIALIELADHGDPDHLPALLAALDDPAVAVRAEAARLVAGWDEADAAATLAERLAARLLDPAPEVRDAAAQSLSELKAPQAGPALLPWARHPDAFA